MIRFIGLKDRLEITQDRIDEFAAGGHFGEMAVLGAFKTAFLEINGHRIEFESFIVAYQKTGDVEMDERWRLNLWRLWYKELIHRRDRLGHEFAFVRAFPKISYQSDAVKLSGRYATATARETTLMISNLAEAAA